MELTSTVKVNVPLSETEEAMISELQDVDVSLHLGQLYTLVKAAFVEGRIVGESWTDSDSFKWFEKAARDIDAAMDEEEDE